MVYIQHGFKAHSAFSWQSFTLHVGETIATVMRKCQLWICKAMSAWQFFTHWNIHWYRTASASRVYFLVPTPHPYNQWADKTILTWLAVMHFFAWIFLCVIRNRNRRKPYQVYWPEQTNYRFENEIPWNWKKLITKYFISVIFYFIYQTHNYDQFIIQVYIYVYYLCCYMNMWVYTNTKQIFMVVFKTDQNLGSLSQRTDDNKRWPKTSFSLPDRK